MKPGTHDHVTDDPLQRTAVVYLTRSGVKDRLRAQPQTPFIFLLIIIIYFTA